MPEPRRSNRTFEVLARAALSLTLLVAASSTSGVAQTISGTLLDAESDRPIPLGLVMMFTTDGDSITATVSHEDGRFELRSPDPGSFVLLAAALGYEETSAGVFELGDDGEMEVEYRLPSRPLPIDELIVSIDRPLLEHHLVRNGFVRRLQRGLGHFITPYEIERSPARSTEALMEGIPQVQVRTTRGEVGGVGLPMAHLGETVQVMAPTGGWCTPQVYVDGIPMSYEPGSGFTLTQLAPLQDVEAVEVYRRPAEIPVEFAPGTQNIRSGRQTGCGLLLVWTKRGLAAGQRTGFGRADDVSAAAGELPVVDEVGPAPVKGETIRVALDQEAARSRGLVSPWQGTFEAVEAGQLVAIDDDTGLPVALPVETVSQVQVSRREGGSSTWLRALVGGAAVGAGTWGFLELLCWYTCGDSGRDREPTLVPGVLAGLAVGTVVVIRGPGEQWVRTSLPGSEDRSGSGDAGGAATAPAGGAVIGPGPLPGTLRLGWRFSLR